MTSQTSSRFTFVDTLRGLAACWVVLFHLNETGRFEPNVYQAFVKLGWLGVPAFFVISGFSVQLSLSRAHGVLNFLRRRFWRLYPPYVASLVVVLAVIVARKLLTGSND